MKMYTKTISEISKNDAFLVGGKGAKLSELFQEGIAIPNAFIVTSNAYTTFLEVNDLPSKIKQILSRIHKDSIQEISNASTEILNVFTEARIPEEITEEIISMFSNNGFKNVAVRSSATCEDGDVYAWAGQLESFLHIDKGSLLDKVVLCWASFYSPQAIQYQLQNNFLDTKSAVAVIIQQMLFSEKSGVAFSEHPTQESKNLMLIEAIFGLGESLVSGLTTPDSYVVQKKPYILKGSTIQEKTQVLYCKNDMPGVEWKEVPQSKRNKGVLTPQELYTLYEEIIHIEKHYGTSVDIEWAFQKGKLYILQSRPITTQAFFKIFDNSNIAESYTGVTTPLTFSFVQYVYQEVYKHFCKTMGVRTGTISKNTEMFEHMVEHVGSHIYYNLLSWYKMISFFPGYNYSQEFMENMMGVEKKFAQQECVQQKFFQKYIIELPRTIYLLVRISFSFLSLHFSMNRFNTSFDIYVENIRKKNIQEMDTTELTALYKNLDTTLLKKWRFPIVNDFAVMVSNGLLEKISGQSAYKQEILLSLRQIKSKKKLISALPGELLQKIISSILSEINIYHLFITKTPETIFQEITDIYSETETAKNISMYIKKYGNRIPNELKLETMTLSEDPLSLILILKKNVAIETSTHTHTLTKKIHDTTYNKKLYTSYGKYLLLCILSAWNTQSTVHREESRFRRGIVFDIVRKIFLRFETLFIEQNIITTKGDIFFLTVEEVFECSKNKSNAVHLQIEIEKRKQSYTSFTSISMPRRIETRRSIQQIESMLLSKTKEFPPLKPYKQLKGTVTSCQNEGWYTGTALVLDTFSPSEDYRGKILVTRHTDPGWTSIFPFLQGIIVENGGSLSHASIIAREFGIMCVVGASNATQLIKNNDTLRVNSDTGEIHILRN